MTVTDDRVAIITGSGVRLDDWLSAGERTEVAGAYGEPSAAPWASTVGGRKVLVLPRHGDDGAIAPHCVNYRANIAALAAQQVNLIFAINAVGGIDSRMTPPSLVVPDQLIDYTAGREHTFFDTSRRREHIDFTQPFSPRPRDALLRAAAALPAPVFATATCAVTQGPRLETAAEINRLERDGCDIVGMTSMPEAALAREAGLEYAAVCVVVNQAAGRGSVAIDAELQAWLSTGMQRAQVLVTHALGLIPPG